MKLSRTAERGIEVLKADGAIGAHEAKVLRAGIAAIFRNGRNRIVLDLSSSGARALPNEVLRELSELNALARELSGEIVLAGIDAETDARISLLSQPPIISCFPTRQMALASFAEPVEPDEPDEPKAPPLPPSPGAPTEKPPETDSALRAEAEKLRAHNRDLLAAIESMVLARRRPEDVRAYDEKIRLLEDEVLKLNNQLIELEK